MGGISKQCAISNVMWWTQALIVFVLGFLLSVDGLDPLQWKRSNRYGTKTAQTGDLDPLLEPITEYSREIRGIGMTKKNEIPGDASFETDPKTGKVTLVSGMSFDVWQYIAQFSNLTIVVAKMAIDWDPLPSGDTLVDYLREGEADVSLTIMSSCCNRDQMHEFSDMLFERSFSVIYYPPDLTSDIFSVQFSSELWTIVFATIVSLFVFMIIFTLIFRARKPDLPFLDITSWIFCIVAQQGSESQPRSISGKLVFLTGYLFGMLCFLGFSANIVTTLSSTQSLQSIEELIDYEKITIFSSHFAPFRTYVGNSKNPIAQKLFKRIEENPAEICRPVDVNICDEALLSRMAFNNDSTIAFVGPTVYNRGSFEYTKYPQISCRLHEFEVPLGKQGMMYGLRKGLPQKGDIRKGYIRLRETGLLPKVREPFVVAKNKNCAEVTSLAYHLVTLGHVSGAFYLLLAGYGLSIAITLLEFLHFQNMKAS